MLPALQSGRVALRLTPVGGSIVGAFVSQRVTMRPEVMYAVLRLIKMLQLFLRHSHTGECNFWKRFYCIFIIFPLIASYRLELRKGKGSNGLSYGAIAFHLGVRQITFITLHYIIYIKYSNPFYCYIIA